MLHHRALQSLSLQLRGQLSLVQNYRAYSAQSGSESEAADLDAAREWFQRFNKSTIPAKICQTTYSRSSGPGGQKVNKTSSKATTVWPLYALQGHVPKALHQGLRDSNYFVASSDSISIQCDTTRSQSGNKEETHTRLYDEITQIYKRRVPGITSPEQKQKIEHLITEIIPGHKMFAGKKWDDKEVKNRLHQVQVEKVMKRKIVSSGET